MEEDEEPIKNCQKLEGAQKNRQKARKSLVQIVLSDKVCQQDNEILRIFAPKDVVSSTVVQNQIAEEENLD